MREQVVSDATEALGPSHPDTLIAMRQLAKAYFECHDLPAARRVLSGLLEGEERIEDPNAELTRRIIAAIDERASGRTGGKSSAGSKEPGP
jgi:hypothetical protein